MADPISIAGSIAGLLTLAGTVGKQLRSAYTTFTEAQSVLESIDNEVGSITTVAAELEARFRAPDGVYHVSDLSTLQRIILETRGTLDTIQKKLSQLRCADSSDRKWKRRRWVWEKSEVEGFLQSLQRHKNSLTLGLLSLCT